MIGKIVKGTSFGGCVNYVLKEEKSRQLEAVGVEGTPSEMAEQFELQTLLNDKVKKHSRTHIAELLCGGCGKARKR